MTQPNIVAFSLPQRDQPMFARRNGSKGRRTLMSNSLSCTVKTLKFDTEHSHRKSFDQFVEEQRRLQKRKQRGHDEEARAWSKKIINDMVNAVRQTQGEKQQSNSNNKIHSLYPTQQEKTFKNKPRFKKKVKTEPSRNTEQYWSSLGKTFLFNLPERETIEQPSLKKLSASLTFHTKHVGAIGKLNHQKLNQVYRIKKSANNSLSHNLGSLVDISRPAFNKSEPEERQQLVQKTKKLSQSFNLRKKKQKVTFEAKAKMTNRFQDMHLGPWSKRRQSNDFMDDM